MTAKEKLDMFKEVHDTLVGVAVKLQDFSEDSSEFVDENPSEEQQLAAHEVDQLTGLIGRYAVKVKRLEPPA